MITKITTGQDFTVALRWLREGKRVARDGWSNGELWVGLVAPYLYLTTEDNGIQIYWQAPQTDLLAEDWRIVEDEPSELAALAAAFSTHAA